MNDEPDYSHQTASVRAPNSWNYVRKERRLFTGDPQYQELEKAWQMLNVAYDYEERFFRRDIDEGLTETPLETFMACLLNGYYPPPEILFSIYGCFERYIGFKGKISLEEAFFGPKKRGVGNWSARKATDDPFDAFHTYATAPSRAEESLPSLGERFLSDPMNRPWRNRYPPENVDSFLRSYYRWWEKERKMIEIRRRRQENVGLERDK